MPFCTAFGKSLQGGGNIFQLRVNGDVLGAFDGTGAAFDAVAGFSLADIHAILEAGGADVLEYGHVVQQTETAECSRRRGRACSICSRCSPP